MRAKYSAPFASFEPKVGTHSKELRIAVYLRDSDLLDSATWWVDLKDEKPRHGMDLMRSLDKLKK